MMVSNEPLSCVGRMQKDLFCSNFSKFAHSHDAREFFNEYIFLFLGALHSSSATAKVFQFWKYKH
jgi:hypothetical protein